MRKIIIAIICIFCFSQLPFAETASAASYKYDERNRLIEVIYDNGHTIRYKYDQSGNMVKYSISDGQTVKDYTILPERTIYETNKEWKINVSRFLLPSSVNQQSVFVLDMATQKKVPVKLRVVGNRFYVNGTYEKGKSYMLVAEDLVNKKDQTELFENIQMVFHVK